MSDIKMGQPNAPQLSSASTQWWRQQSFYYAAIIVAIVIVLGVLSKWSEDSKSYSKPFMKKIKSLIEQATRWNSLASQDTNPLLQLTHCNYALCSAQTARNISSDRDVEAITGIDINELVNYFEECQSYCIKNLGQVCPNIKIEGVYSFASGWT